MKKLMCVAVAIAAVGVFAAQVPTDLSGLKRLISPDAGKYNHILLINVAGAVPEKDWPVISTYVATRLQLNIWTNSVEKSIFPAVIDDAGVVKKAFGEKAKICVLIEDSDSALPFVSAPGSWCRVNLRAFKVDKPAAPLYRDRSAKAILKGLAYACGGGVALDRRSVTYAGCSDLKTLDAAMVTISPDAYFPMVEGLRALGGDEIAEVIHNAE